MKSRCASLLVALCAATVWSACSHKVAPPGAFAPFSGWTNAVRSGDMPTISGFYSSFPIAGVMTSTGVKELREETGFWSNLRPEGLDGMDVDVIRDQPFGDDIRDIDFQAVLHMRSASGETGTLYTFVQLIWRRQGEQWHIVGGSRTNLARLKQPESLEAVLYSKSADAHAAIAAAVQKAGIEHKRVLLIFGGNWCYDCHVLHMALDDPNMAPLVQDNYEVVNVDIENMDYNLDIASQYQVPLDKGVPALAVLDETGKLLTSQKQGEFENARSLSPADIGQYLAQWKP